MGPIRYHVNCGMLGTQPLHSQEPHAVLWVPVDQQDRGPTASISEMYADIFELDSTVFPLVKRKKSCETERQKVQQEMEAKASKHLEPKSKQCSDECRRLTISIIATLCYIKTFISAHFQSTRCSLLRCDASSFLSIFNSIDLTTSASDITCLKVSEGLTNGKIFGRTGAIIVRLNDE